jgi:uncharacterized protein involved in outer membrane biogenesis
VAIRRRTKILVAVLATPLVLLLAAVLLLKFYFTSERLKALILPKLQAAINRDVDVKEISISIFPTFGVSLEQLAIANRKGPGFSEQPFISLDEFFLDVKLLPLLGNHLEVNQITLQRPVVLLEVNKNGEENYSNPSEGAVTGQEGRKGLTVELRQGGSLLLSNFEIKDGDFEYVDRQNDRAIRLKGLDSRVHVEMIAEVSEIRTETDMVIGEFSYGVIGNPSIHESNLHIKQNSTLHVQDNKVTLDKGELDIQDLKLGMTGSLTLTQQPQHLDFMIGSEDIDLKQALSLVPHEIVKGLEKAQVEGTARFQANVKGDLGEGKKLEILLDATLANGKIHYADFPKSVTDINFKAKLLSSGSTSRLDIPDFSARLGNNPVKMNLTLTDFEDLVLNAHVEGVVNLSEVKDFYPLEQGKSLSGVLRAKVSIEGKPSRPETLRGNGALEFQDVVVASTEGPPSRVNGSVTFSNQAIEAKGLKVKYGPSDLTLAFTVKNYLSMVFPSTLEKGKGQSSKPSMNVSLTSPYFEWTPSNEPVVIPPFDIDASVAISKLVYNGKEPFECTDIRGNVSSSEKVIRLKNVSLKAYGGEMSASGTIDFRNPKQPLFDVALDAKGADGHLLLSKATSFGDHIFGNISLTMKLKGALSDSMSFLPNSLSGDGVLSLADGKLTGYPATDQLATFLALPEMKEVTFKSWSHAFQIADARVNTPDLKIASRGNDLLISGWQGFDGSLDYKLTVKLSEALSNQFMVGGVASQVADLFRDKEGHITLFLLVGGTTDAPKFRWDTEAAREKLRERVTEELEKKKEQVQEKAKEEIQKKLEEGKSKLQEQLKKLFKKP